MAAPLALVGKIGSAITKLGAAKSGIDLVSDITKRGKIQKQPPTKEAAKNFMGEKPASEQTIGIHAEVLGVEDDTNQKANDLGTFTKTPEDLKPESTGNEDSIVAQINKINSNISAISNAMQSSADIEAKYRKNLEEDLQQDIADRDKLQAKERAKNRRDSFRKNLLSGPKKVAGVAGATAAKGLGLEALALMLGGDEDSWYGLTEEEKEKKGEEKNIFGRGRDDMSGPERFMAGLADAVTFDIFDSDKKGRVWGSRNEEGQRVGPARWMQGFGDAITGNRFDWDGRGKNETTNEITNNTTNKNSVNNVTNEKNTNLTTNLPSDYKQTEADAFDAAKEWKDSVGTSNQSSSIGGVEDKQINSNVKKSTESVISGINRAVDKTAPVEDQKGSIRVFDMTGKGKGKKGGGSTPGKGVSDEVPSLSPERGVSVHEILQRSSVA